MTSELVINAIQHGAPDVIVHLEIHEGRVEIGVTDEGLTCPPSTPGPISHTDTRGRGLRIVAALADSWGVRPRSAGCGKTVDFTVAVAAR